MSEKFQIGLGTYVHDVGFSQSIQPRTMDENDEKMTILNLYFLPDTNLAAMKLRLFVIWQKRMILVVI